MISDRDIGVIANAQRHLPVPERTIEHFRQFGLQPADVYGAIQYLATVLACDPYHRGQKELSATDRARVQQVLLRRLVTTAPVIVSELLLNPELLGSDRPHQYIAEGVVPTAEAGDGTSRTSGDGGI